VCSTLLRHGDGRRPGVHVQMSCDLTEAPTICLTGRKPRNLLADGVDSLPFRQDTELKFQTGRHKIQGVRDKFNLHLRRTFLFPSQSFVLRYFLASLGGIAAYLQSQRIPESGYACSRVPAGNRLTSHKGGAKTGGYEPFAVTHARSRCLACLISDGRHGEEIGWLSAEPPRQPGDVR
jgi:hypothetical protein